METVVSKEDMQLKEAHLNFKCQLILGTSLRSEHTTIECSSIFKNRHSWREPHN